jgi:rubrerythrin
MTFESLLGNLKDNKAMVEEYNFKWIPDMKRSDYMVEMKYEDGMNYTDILRIAMKREEKALKMYNALQKKTNDPEHIRILKVLCQEEAKHKLFLEGLYDDHMAEQGD